MHIPIASNTENSAGGSGMRLRIGRELGRGQQRGREMRGLCNTVNNK